MLILFLGLFRLCGETMFRCCCCGLISLLGGESCCKNCFYRMLNDCTMDWRGFLYAVCKSFLRIAAGEGGQADGKPRCLIVDDTVLEKTGAHNRMEHISRVYDHGRHIHVLGFKLQLVVYFDGVTPIPVDFSIHCEWGKKKDCGLTKKDREARFTKDRAEGTSGRERSDEALQEKPRIFMKMLAKLWRRGLRPQYVLYDSWYHSLGLLRAIRSLGRGAVHALGMDKNGVRTYLVKGRKYTTKTMIDAHLAVIRKCDKYRLMYMKVDAMLDDIPVRLFLIKYGRSSEWKVLVTTDTGMRFTQAFETYQIRWTIEVVPRDQAVPRPRTVPVARLRRTGCRRHARVRNVHNDGKQEALRGVRDHGRGVPLAQGRTLRANTLAETHAAHGRHPVQGGTGHRH